MGPLSMVRGTMPSPRRELATGTGLSRLAPSKYRDTKGYPPTKVPLKGEWLAEMAATYNFKGAGANPAVTRS